MAQPATVTVAVTVAVTVPGPVAAGIDLLDERERARADAFVRVEDRARFVTARALLRRTVGELTGRDPARLVIGARCGACGGRDHGRPVWLEDPTVALSLSRSAERVVVAVALGGPPIGIDVERDVAARFAGFDDVALTPGERATVASLPPRHRQRARIELWVGKEAVLKRAGTGLTREPGELELGSCADVRTDVDVGAGYVCVLASAGAVTVDILDVSARAAAWAARS